MGIQMKNPNHYISRVEVNGFAIYHRGKVVMLREKFGNGWQAVLFWYITLFLCKFLWVILERLFGFTHVVSIGTSAASNVAHHMLWLTCEGHFYLELFVMKSSKDGFTALISVMFCSGNRTWDRVEATQQGHSHNFSKTSLLFYVQPHP